MQPFETIIVDTRSVACNGGGGAMGHPRVFLNLGPEHHVMCPYCSRLFVLEHAREPDAGHEAQANPSRAV